MDATLLSKTATLELDGNTYTFDKLTLGIMADFGLEMSQRRMRAASMALKDASTTDRVELLKSMAYQFTPTQNTADMQTPEGVRLLLWLCARRHHPELTEERLGELLPVNRFDDIFSFIWQCLSDTGEADDEPKNVETATAQTG